MRRLFLLLSVFYLILTASCVQVPCDREWSFADLRLLDPVDNASTPSNDILAVYTRTSGSDFEIRIDLLDISLTPDYNLLVYLDPSPWGTDPGDWQIEISIPFDGPVQVYTKNPSLDAHKIIPRIVRDPWLDTVIVRLNSHFLPRDFKVHVFTIRSLPNLINPSYDMAVNISTGGVPPIQRAPVLLAFWDTYPAATPAQALRRWDGAHSGPRGERHGLKHIFDNAGLYRIPVALLDLKTPSSLAALDTMGITPQIQNLASQGLLILPDVAYGEPANKSLAFSRQAAAGFNLPASLFVFNTSSNLQSNYPAQFLALDSISHLAHSGQTRLIPIPAADVIQATQDGPSLAMRQALVAAAFSGDLSDLVVLGGELPHSTWGNANMAGPTFAWIAAHPWIQPLTGEDLLAFPTEAHDLRLPTTQSAATPLLSALLLAPDNSISDSAWETYFMLTAPTSDEKLLALRTNYLGQVNELLEAARWAERPSTQVNCDHDLNSDSQPDCILSNQDYFAILNPAGARLTNFYSLDEAGPHQLVGPSSQFTVGLSDPSEWRLELGQAADPSVISGAFSDEPNAWIFYTPVVTPEGITFTSLDSSRIKTYRLLDDGIEITYHGSGPVSTRIPLAVDPQAFYFGPTEYTGDLAPGVLTWGLVTRFQVEVRSGAVFSAQSFTDSVTYLSQPEDPDRFYPGGHYMPFPLTVVNLLGSGDFSVQIREN